MDGSSNTVSILASDVLRGLFHYRIVIPLPSFHTNDTPDPMLEVKLIGTYSMSNTQNTNYPPAPGTTTSGFVSAQSIGRQGKRGVWIERGRGSTRRGVVAFETLGSAGGDDDMVGNTPSIDGRVVYDIGSYDLRGE